MLRTNLNIESGGATDSNTPSLHLCIHDLIVALQLENVNDIRRNRGISVHARIKATCNHDDIVECRNAACLVDRATAHAFAPHPCNCVKAINSTAANQAAYVRVDTRDTIL